MKQKDIGILSSIGENAEFLKRVQAACDQAEKNISHRVVRLGNSPLDKAQGNFAEVWHAETFNADTVLNRMEGVKAQVLESHGLKSVDIAVTDGGKTVGEYSSKYYKDANASVNAQKGYGEQIRLNPVGQVEDGKSFIKRQSAKDRAAGTENRVENAKELESIHDKLTDKVEYKKAQSEPLGRKESEEKLKGEKRGEKVDVRPQIDATMIAEEALRSGAVAAGITIGMTVAPRIYNSIVFRCKQGEWQPDTLKTIFEGAGGTGVEAGLRGAVATSLTMSAKAGFLGEAMRNVDPTIIGTLTYIAFEGAKDVTKYANGELTGELLADGLMAKSISASAGAYGAAIGQTLIPVPVLGAMIGAMVGSIAAQQGYQFLDTVSEAYFRSEEFEQLKKINIALAGQWNVFINDYDDWVSHSNDYQKQKGKFLASFATGDALNTQGNDELLKAVEKNDE
jgi:hypothetical protein